MQTFLQTAVRHGELRQFDLQFALHMVKLNGRYSAELLLAAALASNRLAHGDTCLALETVRDSALYSNPDLRAVRQKLPDLERWKKILLEQKVVTVLQDPQSDKRDDSGSYQDDRDDESPSTSIAGQPEGLRGGFLPAAPSIAAPSIAAPSRGAPLQVAPLILDHHNRLYLARYWQLEQSLIASVDRLLTSEPPAVDSVKLQARLASLFAAEDVPDWQQVAVANACLKRFCAITGGPGTGKTYTVTALLSALVDQGVEPKRIALAAPTGKAAARLTQSIHNTLAQNTDKFNLPDSLFEAVTLHSLLGIRFNKVKPRHHREQPLTCDVLIIDEASMIDLPLMARTFEALDPDTRIVLLGDKDQLHSVESGMVLGDLCGGRSQAELSAELCQSLTNIGVEKVPACENPGGRIADHIVYLHKSHRVKDAGGISDLATAVNAGFTDNAMEIFKSSRHANLMLFPHTGNNVEKVLRDFVLPTYTKTANAATPAEAIAHMSESGVLCALRHGPTGAITINRKVETMLAERRVIERLNPFYHGRPIMITANNPHQRLFNGDHGMVFENAQGKLVHFDFDESPGTRKTVSPSRLPQHETFYAMTIHKSQGSEFSTVVVLLPEQDSPILSRELLYTAITRAKDRVIVVANEDQLHTCISRRSVRHSGLQDQFWSSPLAAITPDEDTVQKPAKLPLSKSAPVQGTLDF